MIINPYRVHKYILEKPKVLRRIKQKENSRNLRNMPTSFNITGNTRGDTAAVMAQIFYTKPSSDTQGNATAVMLKHSTPGLPLQRYHDRILPMVSPSLDDSLVSLLTIYGYILQLRLVYICKKITLLGVVPLPYKK